jgi:hypothetical protein
MPGAAQAELRFADGGSYQADGILAMDPDWRDCGELYR